jgi:SpoVK/Ycf46/Vps4 family AAA+-type ATPase
MVRSHAGWPANDDVCAQRGGKGGKGGDQGDAGVARDSVVNQLLAKMDGVAPLLFPTLVIGLTNKRSLIDPALLRPGRFEVHIEVPPPATIAQRVSILQVHTRHMHAAGRLHVTDAPIGSPAAEVAREGTAPAEYTYLELLEKIARETNGFSGASLAAVARSAASFALERAVEDFAVQASLGTSHHTMLQDCVVTLDDLQRALNDVRNVGETDHSNDETSSSVNGDEDKSIVDPATTAEGDLNARTD